MRKRKKSEKTIKVRLVDIKNLILFMLLIPVYLVFHFVKKLSKKLKLLKGFESFLQKIIYLLDRDKEDNMAKTELISLAIENMSYKKKRTSVTIGGMTVGIASIVFLVSIGYGLQALVIDRVARLEELRQAEISTVPGSNLLVNNETIESFAEIENVDMVLPQIAVAGKVNYNNSLIDTAVYGVTKDYLDQSAIAPVKGKIFESNELDTDIKSKVETFKEEKEPKVEVLPNGWVEVEGESTPDEQVLVSKIIFPPEIEVRNAVVNKAFLRVLSLNEEEALSKTFKISFIATSNSLITDQDRIESTVIEYRIIGVTPDEITPLIYIPFVHLKALGIDNYSQMKVVVNKESNLREVRNDIESKGYATTSVSDTVDQINQLFATAKIALASLGTIALFVAALGMFNTLTVSLLERFREIGLLKTMGMKSTEVRDLFLAESMIMGSTGGFLGLLTGLAVGKILEFFLSMYAISQNIGSITIVSIPWSFAVLVILLSFVVGVLTGIYPAKQATKISALNALRYE